MTKCDRSKEEQKENSNANKAVRFNERVDFFSSVPWHQKHEDIDNIIEEPSDTDKLLPMNDCFKYPVYNLRPQMEDGNENNWIGYIILIIVLLFIFWITWSFVSHVLLLEIESQVSDKTSTLK